MTRVKFLFLDVDGVLNGHEAHENGYCGMRAECVSALNYILEEDRDVQLVVSSAWRYLVLGGQMTVKGLESLLLTHGVNCYGRVYGVTRSDEEACGGVKDWEYLKEHGAEVRADQISNFVRHEQVERRLADPEAPAVRFVVLDDLEIPIPDLVRTDGAVGLTRERAEQVLLLLGD